MIKTLRITSIIAAVLAAVFMVSLAVFGARRDKRVYELLKSPGVVEKFRQAKGTTTQAKGQTSPLEAQAKAFATYLNPPPKPKPAIPSRPPTTVKPTGPRPMGAVSAKFTLRGTAFYAARPELSIALIDNPGEGSRWVRQGSKVGHLLIEQVKSGIVVVRDGQRTFELVVEKMPQRFVVRSLTSGESSSEPALATLAKTTSSVARSSSRPVPGRGITGRAATTSKTDNAAVVGSMINELEAMQADIKAESAMSGADILGDAAFIDDVINNLEATKAAIEAGEYGPEEVSPEDVASIDKFIAELKAMRVSDEEAEKLDDLGKELNGDINEPIDDSEEPIEDSNLTEQDVVEDDANSQVPPPR